MTAQPGWHPDPAPPMAGQPPQLRYWDGARWTEHTAPQPQAYPYAAPVAVKSTTTPDGVPLATWGQRLGAYVIDGLILGVLSLVAYIPFYQTIFDRERDYFHQVQRANDNGTASPSPFTLERDLLGTLLVVSAIGLVLSLAWTVGWLRWKQATPGKLALGLRVRRRDTPGPMAYGTILRRWLAQIGVTYVSVIPIVGSLVGFYSLLDGLWPLWDDKRQALHDEFAATNVVRIR